MRRLLVLLMIALLPLRVWAGDLMSIEMAGAHAAGETISGMPADCPMQGVNQDRTAQPDSDASPAFGSGCGSCELCLPFVQQPALELQQAPFIPHAQRLLGAQHFLSAPIALGFKPPIS